LLLLCCNYYCFSWERAVRKKRERKEKKAKRERPFETNVHKICGEGTTGKAVGRGS